MPIHLSRLSRREFLGRTVAAGAGLALGPELVAAPQSTDPDSWALLADIHLAADRGLKARGINMTEHFKNVTHEVLELPARPAGAFVVGDCAYNSGETGDYAVVAELLGSIRQGQVPIHLALGNHDNRERFWDAFEQEKAAKRPVVDRQASLLRTSRVNWFLLDSLQETLVTPGRLGAEQLRWLAEVLDANSKKPALVLVHHNPGNDEKSCLLDTAGLFEVIRPRKQVKAYIYGHTHTWRVEQDASGIHLINLPPVAYVFAAGEPSGWVQAKLGNKGMRLELRCIDRTHKAHGEVHELKWR